MNRLMRCLVPGMLMSVLGNAVLGDDAQTPQTIEPTAGVGSSASRPVVTDRLELDTASIRGNQELPRVLYIVPWKDPSMGNLVGKPVNSLIDEVLAPVDRDVFRRQTNYFDQLYTDTEVELGD